MRSGRKTGLWYDEFAIPYSVFKSHALDITVASPLGGRAPIDRQSLSESQGEILAANQALENTVPLASLSPQLFDAIYLPGGNGTMYDLARSRPALIYCKLTSMLGGFLPVSATARFVSAR